LRGGGNRYRPRYKKPVQTRMISRRGKEWLRIKTKVKGAVVAGDGEIRCCSVYVYGGKRKSKIRTSRSQEIGGSTEFDRSKRQGSLPKLRGGGSVIQSRAATKVWAGGRIEHREKGRPLTDIRSIKKCAKECSTKK